MLSHCFHQQLTTQGLVWVLAYLLSLQIPTNVPGKAADDGLSAWGPATHIRHPDGDPGSWFQPDLTEMTICDICLALSFQLIKKSFID